MAECTFFPYFSIWLDTTTWAEYRQVGKRFEKRVLVSWAIRADGQDWAECSMANYALALLKAHEQEAEE